MASPCTLAGGLPVANGPGDIDVWLRALSQCDRDAFYLSDLGHRLNQLGRYAEAVEHLERALLFDPGLKGAEVDYAIALAGIGDEASALAMLESLLAESSLPPALRDSLTRMRAATVKPEPWQARAIATLRVGRDSNVLGAPNLSELTLTIGGLPVLLPLDENFLAVPGPYARADLYLEARRLNDDGSRWDMQANLRKRYTPTIQQGDSSAADFSITRSHWRSNPDRPYSHGHYLELAGGAFMAATGTRYTTIGAGGGWGAMWNDGWVRGCQGRVGAEGQNRDYRSNPVLSSRYAGAVAYLACERASGVGWQAGVRAGRDWANNPQRPGADQNQALLRLSGFLPVWPWLVPWRETPSALGGILLDTELSTFRDTSGYSPLLENNALRVLGRQAARVEYQTFVAKALQMNVGYEWVNQTSNLALFRIQNRGPYLVLRAFW